MIFFPNAKINLGLDVLRKLPNGFHQISSCFIPIDWYDILEVIPAEKYSFQSTGIDIPGSEDHNLCTLAFEMLKKDFNLRNVAVHLHKNIPIGAGLGGGSADGAFMLKALNQLFDLSLTVTELETYAGKLGSDCPFFIKNEPIIASGTGTTFSPLQTDLKQYFIVLVYPNIHISTKEAYSNINPAIPKIAVSEILSNNTSKWKSSLKNDFEASLFPNYPVLKNIKQQLYEAGAVYASMTGSGSTVFGLFNLEIKIAFGKDYRIHFGKLLI